MPSPGSEHRTCDEHSQCDTCARTLPRSENVRVHNIMLAFFFFFFAGTFDAFLKIYTRTIKLKPCMMYGVCSTSLYHSEIVTILYGKT